MEVIVRPANDIIDYPSWDEFSKKLLALIDADFSHIILDLEQVEHMNSSTIGTIISSHTKMAEAGRQLSLINLNNNLADLLKHMRLTEILTIR
ncbi:MAG: STAS domain-containing protein [Deltaproteobacteria bacterium]|nr:STAS domain-containing protein [Candidatus Anaeroferrophillus wilburensis]MBN2889351.1 STAS domain-containing protein [Deltaproteobacteria bacterium]